MFSMVDGAPVKRFPARRGFVEELIIQAVAVGGLLLSLRLALKYLDPYKEQREQAKKRAAFLKKVLGRNLDLNEFEQLLAANVINPKYIDVSLEDVSGLDELVEELELKVLMPMIHPELYCTSLWKPAKGVLLYGPPGTGKTMLAKALAKHSGCYFLNITASSIMSKWLGDANRLVRAIFTLAEKLQPCIIFIDEVDALLGKRGLNQEHEASLQVKTGIVDEAVLRRFSVQHEVGLPDAAQRSAILRSYLRRHVQELGPGAVDPTLLVPPTTPGGATALEWLAAHTPGFSGSDLMELCSQAAQRVLSEYLMSQKRQHKAKAATGATVSSPTASASSGSAATTPAKITTDDTAGPSSAGTKSDASSEPSETALRSLTLDDFKAVLSTMRASGHKADEYTKRSASPEGADSATAAMLLQFMARLAQGANANVEDP